VPGGWECPTALKVSQDWGIKGGERAIFEEIRYAGVATSTMKYENGNSPVRAERSRSMNGSKGSHFDPPLADENGTVPIFEEIPSILLWIAGFP
jgi:hypothetical protein